MISIVVRVKPGSFKDELTLEEDGVICIRIRERPIDGAANDSLIKFLAKVFSVSKSCILLEKGGNSRIKKIRLAIDPVQFNKTLQLYKKKEL